MTTPAQDLAKLLYSYNPDLPMGPGMKAEYLALRIKLDAQAASDEGVRKHSHYFKDVSNLQNIDVYRVLELFAVVNPCLQHAVKKLLVAGGRGAKDIQKDVQEAIDTLERWKEMGQEDCPTQSWWESSTTSRDGLQP